MPNNLFLKRCLFLLLSKYVKKKKKKKVSADKHLAYMEQLRLWTESEYSHPKVAAIYKYLSKGELIRDLIEKKNMVRLDENGFFTSDKI